MSFETPAQKACFDRILPWMREIFGDFLDGSPEGPDLSVMVGSARLHTRVAPFEQDAVIRSRAYVATEVPHDPGLHAWLLEQNERMVFGGFGLDARGDVFLQHSLLGSTCDREELEASVLAVALLADLYDDEIVSRWGGRRALDRGATSP